MAAARLKVERKNFRKERPPGFYAQPKRNDDGSRDLFVWQCKVPGKKGTPWEGGAYPCVLRFPKDYPTNPPSVAFNPPIFHPNVFTNGLVCLSILKPEVAWKPTITAAQILRGLQDLLDEPNNDDPANCDAAEMADLEPEEYAATIRELARKFPAED